jgi:hypothetical protein
MAPSASDLSTRIRCTKSQPEPFGLAQNCAGFLCQAESYCWTKPLRGGKTSAIFILSLSERLSNREKSWQNATHTVSGNEPERIMRITEKNLAMCKKIA